MLFLLHCTATAAVAVTAEKAWNFVCSKDNAIDRNPKFPDKQKLSLSQMSAAEHVVMYCGPVPSSDAAAAAAAAAGF